jgi:hypothetical protein
MPASTARREFAKGTIDRAIRRALAATAGKPRRAFAGLLWVVQSRSEMLRPARYIGRTEADRVERLVLGLLALVGHRKHYLRPVETWVPQGAGPLPQFSSLAHHLLADYPVPPVLLSAWFRGTDWDARQQQGWFKHVGLGKSLRTAGLPIWLTRRMAHAFAHAPAQFPIEFALRWAQVRGLGGSDELARAVAATRLGRDFDNDEFWISVIHFLRNTIRLDPARVGPIIEYLHDQKFEAQRVIIGDDTEVYLGPAQPDLSVKGRTLASMWRQVAEWEARRRSAQPERRVIRWGRSGVGEYRTEDREGRTWEIRELLDSDALAAEGKAMKHCVATYTESCARGLSSIWSLGREGPGGRERLVTIEVSPRTREVVQAKARCNEEPDEPCRAILDEWAGREGLKLEG